MNEIKILGLDIGNSYCKTSKGIKFKSKVSTDYGSSFKRNVVQVTRNGNKYLVGDESGQGFREINKFKDENYITCLLTAIVLSYPEDDLIDVKVVLGIPIEYYDKFRDRCVEDTLAIGSQTLLIDNRSITINIIDALVYPQSAILGDKTDDSSLPALIFDCGGVTLDLSIWNIDTSDGNRRFIKDIGKSYSKLGFDKVLEDYALELSSEYGLDFTEAELIDSLSQDEYKGIGGVVDLKMVRDKIIGGYINRVFGQIKDDSTPYRKCKTMHIIGGATQIILPYIIENGISEEVLIINKHPQFTNARIFEVLGELNFDKANTNNVNANPTVANESVGEV